MVSDHAVKGPCRRTSIDSNDLPDGLALFNRDNGEAYYLNPTATLLWEMCDGRPEKDITQAFASILEIDDKTSADYVTAGLEAFRSSGIIEREAIGTGTE